MKKYTAIITFKIEIEAIDQEAAEYVAKQATCLPARFLFRCDTGNGQYLRGLSPVVFEDEVEKEGVPEGYWRNR